MQTALLCQVFQDFKNVAEFSSKGNLIPRRIVEAFPSHIVPHLQLFLGYTLISFFKGAILPQLKKKTPTTRDGTLTVMAPIQLLPGSLCFTSPFLSFSVHLIYILFSEMVFFSFPLASSFCLVILGKIFLSFSLFH